MHALTENKIQKLITRRNSNTYIRCKIALRFSVLFIIGFALGIAFFNYATSKENLDLGIISKHFLSIFVNCDTISDYLITMLAASEGGIRHLLFIFISGFTYFCFLASATIIFSRGVLLGFSLAYMVYAHGVIPGEVSIAIIILYLVAHLVSAILMVHLATVSYIFSFDFRAIKRNHSVLRRAPITYRYSFAFILALGGILINNLLYCIISKILL